MGVVGHFDKRISFVSVFVLVKYNIGNETLILRLLSLVSHPKSSQKVFRYVKFILEKEELNFAAW